MKIKSFTKKQSRVEMMPLIDTMFLLLVFFIYTMLNMVVHKGIDVDLPKGKKTVSNKEDYHVVILTESGEVYVNEDLVTIETLGSHLAGIFENPEEAVLYLRVDKSVEHGRVVSAMDELRILGIRKMFFEVEQKK
ncbi:hypothetical protein AB834_05475 [PVC group bacterium (ex Bugula neritina AB1)]|nr:hypothetical protein AB834_05475 [PVC group bacterium (ex Bugula neritina AB1)]